MEGSNDDPFETHCVIELAPKCSEDMINWLIYRIRSPKATGGAELMVRPVRDTDSNRCCFLHVSSPFYRLMETAEWLQIMKPDIEHNGELKEFAVKALPRFVPDVQNPDRLFTYAEKARMANFEINELRAKDDELERFRQSDDVRFNDGQSIITKLIRKDLIIKIFPLHDKEALKRLSTEWIKVSLVKKQPLDTIRSYFGEHIALYFAFLGFYTEMLVPASILGVSMFAIQWFSHASLSTTVCFAIFNVVWATFFFERWKRYCNRICYRWGTIHKTNRELELPRAQFKGEMGKNPVTGQPEPVYPEFSRNLWIGLVSIPVVSLCLFLTVFMMGSYMTMQRQLRDDYEKHRTIWLFFVRFFPSALYTVCINAFRTVYKYVATWLTDKENHRLQVQYEFHLIWKLLVFNFVNSFLSLFFIAFWLQDLNLLRSHLAAQLVTNQIIDQFQETVFPFLKIKFQIWRAKTAFKKDQTKRGTLGKTEDPHFEEMRKQAAIEGDLPEYLGTFDDYLELLLQFGYCFLFSSAFPVAALFALINNVVEIRSDGFKLCNVMQRPFSRPASSIGPWQLAFELMGFAAVATNLALIYTSGSVKHQFPELSDHAILIAFVVFEHLLIFLKFGVAIVLPNVPKDVQLGLARSEYDMKQALKQRRADETRKQIEAQRAQSRRGFGTYSQSESLSSP